MTFISTIIAKILLPPGVRSGLSVRRAFLLLAVLSRRRRRRGRRYEGEREGAADEHAGPRFKYKIF